MTRGVAALLVAAALTACAGGPSVGRSAPPPAAPATVAPPAPGSVEAALRDAAARRHTAPSSCHDTCCPDLAPPTTISPSDRPSLRQVIATTPDPTVRALAITKLAFGQEITDVDVIEPHLGSVAIAYQEPMAMRGQAALACDPVLGWRATAVGEVALQALSRLSRRYPPFRTADEYRAWRTAHPNLQALVLPWIARLDSAGAQGCRALVASLAERDVTMLLRVSAARHQADPVQPRRDCPAPEQVVAELRGRFGVEPLLARVADPASWPLAPDDDPRDANSAWRKLGIWALDHAEAIFEPGDAQALEALLDVAAVQAEPKIAGRVAAAVAVLSPGRADPVLRRAAALVDVAPYPFARAFARRFPADPEVAAWLRSKAEDGISARGAALGLVEAGKPGVAVLTRYARKDIEEADGWLLHALIRALESRGAELGCADDLGRVCRKSQRETCGERLRAVDRRRADCFERIRQRLASEAR